MVHHIRVFFLCPQTLPPVASVLARFGTFEDVVHGTKQGFFDTVEFIILIDNTYGRNDSAIAIIRSRPKDLQP